MAHIKECSFGLKIGCDNELEFELVVDVLFIYEYGNMVVDEHFLNWDLYMLMLSLINGGFHFW
jgi:hypothetical protein